MNDARNIVDWMRIQSGQESTLMTHILLVEDDEELAAVIRRELEAENYSVRHARDGQAGLSEFGRAVPGLIILDWMLPGVDGLGVLREVRRTSFVPVLMLTARRDEVDRVVGLEIGADDYLTKPFSMKELIARVRALLRRVEHTRQLIESDTRQDRPIADGGLELDPQAYVASLDGTPLDLSLTEFRLLYLLMANPGRTFTRRYLMSTVWDQEYYPGDRSIDNAILRLRKKLGDYGDNIETVRGLGYRFNQ